MACNTTMQQRSFSQHLTRAGVREVTMKWHDCAVSRRWVFIRYRTCSTATNVLQKIIAGHLLIVTGLSLSNKSVHNAYFMPCHLLYRCTFPSKSFRHATKKQTDIVCDMRQGNKGRCDSWQMRRTPWAGGPAGSLTSWSSSGRKYRN